jgi:hypothetical protein
MKMTEPEPMQHLSRSACNLLTARGPRSGSRRVQMMLTGTRRHPARPVPVPAAGPRRERAAVGCAALVVGAVSSIRFGTSPVMALSTSRALGATAPVPGTSFVANGGGAAQGASGTGPGSVTLYRPGSTGDVRPKAVVTKGIDGPGGIAVDSSGDLWVANETGAVVEYSRAELAKASPVPSVTISYGAGGLAFDPSGNLWVDNGSTVVEFTKVQLAKSGSPKPVVTINPGADNCSVAFDASGDLWLGSSGNAVFEWTKAELKKSGSPGPRVTISSSSLTEPCKSAFDGAGDLWAGNYGGTTVVEFTKAQVSKSGSPAPRVVISSSRFYSGSGDVAVSSSGDLWAPHADAGTVVEYTKAELAKSGSPALALTIAGPATGLNWPWAVAIES